MDIYAFSSRNIESESGLLIIIAELIEREVARAHPDIGSVVLLGQLSNSDESVLAWDLLQDLQTVEGRLLAHAEAATNVIVNACPVHGPLGFEVGLLDGLGAHNDLTTVIPVVLEVGGPGLALGTHQVSHGDLN